MQLLDLGDYVVAATEDEGQLFDLLHVASVELAAAKQQLLRFFVQVLNFSDLRLVRQLVNEQDYCSRERSQRVFRYRQVVVRSKHRASNQFSCGLLAKSSQEIWVIDFLVVSVVL